MLGTVINHHRDFMQMSQACLPNPTPPFTRNNAHHPRVYNLTAHGHSPFALSIMAACKAQPVGRSSRYWVVVMVVVGKKYSPPPTPKILFGCCFLVSRNIFKKNLLYISYRYYCIIVHKKRLGKIWICGETNRPPKLLVRQLSQPFFFYTSLLVVSTAILDYLYSLASTRVGTFI